MEEWRDIEGYEGFYQVSDFGNVKSLERIWYSTDKKGNKKKCSNKEMILKPANNGNGYLVVNLSYRQKTKMFLVHRLVAKAFIKNPENKAQVNHIDENKSNNNVKNLEWVTPRENLLHGTRSKRSSVTKCYVIEQYDLEGNFLKEWLGARVIEKELGIKNQHICRCCNGKQRTSGGYKWKYKERS